MSVRKKAACRSNDTQNLLQESLVEEQAVLLLSLATHQQQGWSKKSCGGSREQAMLFFSLKMQIFRFWLLYIVYTVINTYILYYLIIARNIWIKGHLANEDRVKYRPHIWYQGMQLLPKKLLFRGSGRHGSQSRRRSNLITATPTHQAYPEDLRVCCNDKL